MTEISSNIVKVGVHWYLPNAKVNLRPNFNSEKLVKSETLLYGFAEVGIKGVKYFGTSRNFTCTLVYQMGIQIYHQISIRRNCSKVKLQHAFSLGLGLKVVKIAWNIMKVGVHACLSNGHPNLWSSSILRSWSKVKLRRAVLLGFGLKESKITLNIMKVGLHSYLPNAHLNLLSNFNSEKLLKSQTLSCSFH